jgi:hypothetical protein
MSVSSLLSPNSLNLYCSSVRTSDKGIDINDTVIKSSQVQNDYTYQLPPKPTFEGQPLVMVSTLQNDGQTVTTAWVNPEEGGTIPPNLSIDNLTVANNTILNDSTTGITVIKGTLDTTGGLIDNRQGGEVLTDSILSNNQSNLNNITTNKVAIYNPASGNFNPPLNEIQFTGTEGVINIYPDTPISSTNETDSYVKIYNRTGNEIRASYLNPNTSNFFAPTFYRRRYIDQTLPHLGELRFPDIGFTLSDVSVNPNNPNAVYQATLTATFIKDFGTAGSSLEVFVNLGEGYAITGGQWIDVNQPALRNSRTLTGNTQILWQVSVTNYFTASSGLSTVQMAPFCSTNMSSGNTLKIKTWEFTVIQVK